MEPFKRYGELLETHSNGIEERISFGERMFVNVVVTSLNGNNLLPETNVGNTKMTITLINPALGEEDRRLLGLDNHHHSPLHAHCSGTKIFIAGNQNLGSIGSYAFQHLFKNVRI